MRNPDVDRSVVRGPMRKNRLTLDGLGVGLPLLSEGGALLLGRLRRGHERSRHVEVAVFSAWADYGMIINAIEEFVTQGAL